jgi:copper transporter 1
MLFTWDTTNLCIIFRWWHIQTNLGLVLSLLGVVALTAGYEAIRSFSRQYEAWVAKRQEEAPSKLPILPHTYMFDPSFIS